MGLPYHDPVVADRVWPSTAEPLTVGSAVLTGAAGTRVTGALGAEVAWPEPPSSVAVTITRRVWPASVEVSLYVGEVAFAMFVHPSPEVLQSSHW